MAKWEYKTTHFAQLPQLADEALSVYQDHLDRVLNKFGKDSWELVPISKNDWLIVKREMRV